MQVHCTSQQVHNAVVEMQVQVKTLIMLLLAERTSTGRLLYNIIGLALVILISCFLRYKERNWGGGEGGVGGG